MASRTATGQEHADGERPDGGIRVDDHLVDEAIEVVQTWVTEAQRSETHAEHRTTERLRGIVTDGDGVRFVMRFVDRVVRPDHRRTAAAQLRSLFRDARLPGFLGPVDKVLLRAGGVVGPMLPDVVMPLARRRMRMLVGHLVAPAEDDALAAHLARRRAEGYAQNVNLIGEAVLGDAEARRRLDALTAVIDQPDVDYVSAKVSAVASQLDHWAYEDTFDRVCAALRELFTHAGRSNPPTFVNLDMEEYHDLHLTIDAFTTVLDETAFEHQDAGIVLQAYLPDVLGVLPRLVDWANARHARAGGVVKVRLVKGANLSMEQVDAAVHGWEQAPLPTKAAVDANYKRMLDEMLRPGRMDGVRVGLASHNLFDVAWAHLLAAERGVSDRIQFEMLEGMAPASARVVARHTGDDGAAGRLLLYTPAVRRSDFDVAISYLFRRLEENAADDNFLRAMFDLEPGSATFTAQADAFAIAVAERHAAEPTPRRTQDRTRPPEPAYRIGASFRNEPDTDPSLPANQAWIAETRARAVSGPRTPLVTTAATVDDHLTRARSAAPGWAATPGAERRGVLHRVGDELAARRGELAATMAAEARKTLPQADVEISEAIDFARWYGDRAPELDDVAGARFTPFGVVGVVPPWNFPVAIPAGGILSALAAGNTVLCKPSPRTPRCAELVVEACRAAGVDDDVVQLVRTPDDEVGRHLVTGVDAVILTGSLASAERFHDWRPDQPLFAETSGKNALVVTPRADMDLAVADLVASAFGHAGQKCSAASLAILVGDAHDSERFRRQLVDAVTSLRVGPVEDPATAVPPLIGEANERLARAFATLDPGESWLVEPRPVPGVPDAWTPGVRDGVTPDSWFRRTECFGPVLGLVRAADLDEALAIQNDSDYGLTGGIHSLDPVEVDEWIERVEVGNAYVNRQITGAIVQRQPFGGWKRSVIGPGAKAGGPDYVAQLGRWDHAADAAGPDDYADWWTRVGSVEHDPTGLFCEENRHRYRPLCHVVVRTGPDTDRAEVDRARRAAGYAGVRTTISDESAESDADLGTRLADGTIDRVRCVGTSPSDALRRAAFAACVHLAEGPVTRAGRVEMLHYLRPQSVSRTTHRFGNVLAERDG